MFRTIYSTMTARSNRFGTWFQQSKNPVITTLRWIFWGTLGLSAMVLFGGIGDSARDLLNAVAAPIAAFAAHGIGG